MARGVRSRRAVSESLRLGSTVDWCARAIDLGLRTGMLPEVLMERRLHTANLGLRRQDARHQYLDVVKATLQRRRALGLENANPTLPGGGRGAGQMTRAGVPEI